MRTDSPPTLETEESDNLLDYLRHNAGTANKMRKAVRNYCMALLTKNQLDFFLDYFLIFFKIG